MRIIKGLELSREEKKKIKELESYYRIVSGFEDKPRYKVYLILIFNFMQLGQDSKAIKILSEIEEAYWRKLVFDEIKESVSYRNNVVLKNFIGIESKEDRYRLRAEMEFLKCIFRISLLLKENNYLRDRVKFNIDKFNDKLAADKYPIFIKRDGEILMELVVGQRLQRIFALTS